MPGRSARPAREVDHLPDRRTGRVNRSGLNPPRRRVLGPGTTWTHYPPKANDNLTVGFTNSAKLAEFRTSLSGPKRRKLNLIEHLCRKQLVAHALLNPVEHPPAGRFPRTT